MENTCQTIFIFFLVRIILPKNVTISNMNKSFVGSETVEGIEAHGG